MAAVSFHTLSRPHGARDDLGEADIHVWKARLDIPPEHVGRLSRALTAGERERLACLRSEVDRRRATASRGLQKHILAGYAGESVAGVRFTYGPAGRPELADRVGDGSIHFNATHCRDLLLVAVGRVPFIGIDVERIRPIPRADKVARRAFSASERRRIEELAPESRAESFITCWTRKEACVKALGEGVWSAFGRFEVSVEPGPHAEILAVDGDPHAAAPWFLYDLRPAAGYVGALAVRGGAPKVSGGTFDISEAEP